MGSVLSIPITQAAGTALVAAVHVGALEGETAALQGYRLSAGQDLVPRAWPEAPLEVELRPAGEIPGRLLLKTYESPASFALDFRRLQAGQGTPSLQGAEVVQGPAAIARTLRRVVQPDWPFLLAWAEGPVKGVLRSLGLIDHGPSALRIVWQDVTVPGGGGGGLA